jgi:hypothetical protein
VAHEENLRAEDAERKAKMQQLNDALTAKGLPPYDQLKYSSSSFGDILLDVLFAGETRLRNLKSGLIDEPLVISELSAAVDDCVVVQKNIMWLETALAKISIPGFRSYNLKRSCRKLLLEDPELAVVFQPISAKTVAAAIESAVPRLASQLQKLQAGPHFSQSAPRCGFIPCPKCNEPGPSYCCWSMCSKCCDDRFCNRKSHT